MIDKKEMLMKVASYDKVACVLANTVMAYSELKKKAVFDGSEWQSWMTRKDAIEPSNQQHLRAQDNGALTSFLTSLAIGGGLGYLGDKFTGGKHTSDAVLGGTAIGGGLALLANLAGKGAGYVMPTRTKEQHDKYQNSGTAAEWLIPGVANYNKVKTYGYALHGGEKTRDDEDKKKKKEDKETKTASVQSIVDGVLNKKAVDKKAVVIKLLNKAISK